VNVDKCFALLPADTRTPDQTVWHYLDVITAFKAALSFDGGAALLAFALGPVQRFIEAARTVRDLWSGSMILSWLAFRAMLPIIEQLGPTALIYPALRGIPLVDLWLRQQLGQDKVPLPKVKQRLTPSLPHRFLAVVPWGTGGEKAQQLAGECRQAAQQAVHELANAVRKELRKQLDGLFAGWDRRWDQQVGNYFSFATAVIPLGGSSEEVDERLARLLAGKGSFGEAFPNAEVIRELAQAIPDDHRPNYDQDHAGRWQYQVELVQRSLAAQRSVRFVPQNHSINPNERCPQKCSLLGSFEQMGPDELHASRQFWDQAARQVKVQGVRIRVGEALCAIALVKRFAGPALLADVLQVEPQELRFPDTATVAAAEWLQNAGISPDEIRRKYGYWNGHWLHWPRPDFALEEGEPCPEEVFERIQSAKRSAKVPYRDPPIYYAILKLDGDELGGWLRGEKSPQVREVMHPDLVKYYEGLAQAARKGLDAQRPVSPALHVAISTALANFALQVVPDVVAKHHGTVIYSGGDDTLALLPISTVLRCARELQQAYTSDWYSKDQREYLMMGSRATISGGIVVVHAKDDLRLALADARRAEDRAKEAGRNVLAITIRRRSGEHTTAVCPWSFVERVDKWRLAFAKGASDRWTYHLKAEEQTLAALEAEAVRSEIRRQVNRAESETRQLLSESKNPERAGDILASDFGKYRECLMNERHGFDLSRALSNWLTLCQTASFLARGKYE
jgi:CRISPR-associated protein Cmr2